MLLSAELIGDTCVLYQGNQNYQMYFLRDDVIQSETQGQDTYLRAGLSLPGAVIAATGRRYSRRDMPGMSPEPESGAVMQPLDGEGFEGLSLAICTNAILSCAVLKTDYCVGIHTKDSFEVIPLILLTIHEKGLGEYRVDLAPLDYMLSRTWDESQRTECDQVTR